MRGLDLRDILEIPPPITEENKDRYLEELSKITEADDWIERHSIENKCNQDVNKDNNISQDSEKKPNSMSITSAIVDESLRWILFLIFLPVATVVIGSGVALIWVMGMLILGY